MISQVPNAAGEPPSPPNERLLGSALKCLALIDELAGCPGPAGVAELAKLTGARRGTVHQQLRTLTAAGWVEQTEDSRYRLTLRALEIASAVLEQADLGSRVLPTLTALAASSGETAAIAVLDSGAALIVQRVAADRTLKVDIKSGTRMPLATSASGRVLSAFGPEHEIERYRRDGVELPSADIIEAARRSRCASQLDEMMIGMASIAVPVRSPRIGIVALSLTAPSPRFDHDALLNHLRGAEAEITEFLGGQAGMIRGGSGEPSGLPRRRQPPAS
jgi:DNA-binding IclR family transcriptional regulator